VAGYFGGILANAADAEFGKRDLFYLPDIIGSAWAACSVPARMRCRVNPYEASAVWLRFHEVQPLGERHHPVANNAAGAVKGRSR
jgi:hypothetical protein